LENNFFNQFLHFSSSFLSKNFQKIKDRDFSANRLDKIPKN